MRKKGLSKRRIVMTIASLACLIYIGWRVFFTIPVGYGVFSFVVGLLLIICESLGVMEAFFNYRNMGGNYEPEKPVIKESWYPTVDIMIATHNEPVELLYKTVNACTFMKYPDKSKVNIYICDDNNRSEMYALAKQMGVGYSGIQDNKWAKSGNLNHAIGLSNGELIVTFDADMIPREEFLMETVPYFFLPRLKKNKAGEWVEKTPEEIEKSPSIGFVQTPQSFYNADLFQFNLYAERNIPNEQDYFFKDINVGRNRTNSPIYAGSNTVISRQALEDVGGIVEGNITEDFATGIRIQALGYRCYALSQPLAHGLAPGDFKSLIKQRQRWGRGCVQTIRSFKFLFSKLSLGNKMSYIMTMVYWWTFFRRFVYILSPILFAVFGVIIVSCELWELMLIWLPTYLIYNKALKISSGNIRDQKWSNIVDTIIFPYMIGPILAETFGIKLKKFAVTPKEALNQKNTEMKYAIPHFMLLGANTVGIVFCLYNLISNKSIGDLAILYWLGVNEYFLGMAILFMCGRINYREGERFYAQIPVVVETSERTMEGITTDLSEGGLGVKLDYPWYIPVDEEISLSLSYKKYQCTLKGEIRHVQNCGEYWKYSVKIVEIREMAKRHYIQMIYDRNHSLPNVIQSKLIKDVRTAVKGRMDHGFSSNRRLPRIWIGENFETDKGRSVKVMDYNYEFLKIEGLMPTRFVLTIGNGMRVSCLPQLVDEENHVTLCHVEEWKAVAMNEDLQRVLLHKQYIALENRNKKTHSAYLEDVS